MLQTKSLERLNLILNKDKKARCQLYHKENTLLNNSVTLNLRIKAGVKATLMTKLSRMRKNRNSKMFMKEQT